MSSPLRIFAALCTLGCALAAGGLSATAAAQTRPGGLESRESAPPAPPETGAVEPGGVRPSAPPPTSSPPPGGARASAEAAPRVAVEPSDADSVDLRLTGELLTDVPLGIGLGVGSEMGPRVRLGVSFAWIPRAYVDLADAVAREVGGYDDATSAVIRASTEDAFALRAHLGMRPFEELGLYFDAKWSLLLLSGTADASDFAEIVNASTQEAQVGEWDISTVAQQLGVEIGWQFALPEQLSLRIGVGMSFTVAADVGVEARDPVFPRLASAAAVRGEEELRDAYTENVHLPVLSVAVGYALFDSARK